MRQGRRRTKRTKNSIKQYTAFVPKTVKATKNIGKKTVDSLDYFLSRMRNMVKNTTKKMDKKVAKSIYSIGKSYRKK